MDIKLRLVYYLWVPEDGFTWTMNIHWTCLEYYHNVFDSALFLVATNSGKNKYNEFVLNKIKSIGFKNLEIKIVNNLEVERESRYLKTEIFDKLGEYDGLTFFAHTKSTRTSYLNGGWSNEQIALWPVSMYYFNLNYIEDVKERLVNGKYLSYGFDLLCNDWITTKYKWIYSGTFFWINDKKLKQYVDSNNIEMPTLYSWTTEENVRAIVPRYYSESVLSAIYPKEYAFARDIKGERYLSPNEHKLDNLKNILYEEDYKNLYNFYKEKIMDLLPKNKICVYAIAKNESQFVERWYNSMKEADSVVVLDTGSTDDTAEKLVNLGVTVKKMPIIPWRFDVARNESMKLIPTDCNILVCTDLDEYFEPGWGDILRERWIEGQHVMCDYTYYLASNKKILYNKICGRGWHWKYPVHEFMVRDGNEDYPSNDQILNLGDVIVLHHKPDTTKSRSSYFELLELRAKEDPKDFYGLYYLALEYSNVDIQKAIETAKRGIEVSDNDFYKFVFNVCVGRLYEQIGESKKSLVYFINGLNKCKEFRFVFYHAAKILFDTYKDYIGAYNLLMDGLKNSYFHDYWFEEKEGCGYEYYDLLSMSAFYSGNKVDSLIYALIASEKDKDNQRLKDNIDLISKQITDKEICDYAE